MPERLTSFVSPDLNARQWKEVAPYYDDLIQSAEHIKTTLGLKRLIRQFSDLLSTIFENSANDAIQYWGNTNSILAKRRCEQFYDAFYKPWSQKDHELAKLIHQHPSWKDMTAEEMERYKPVRQTFRWELDSFQPKNMDIDIDEGKTCMDVDEITGNLTVEIDEGNPIPILGASSYLESPDRAEREHAWKKIWDARLDIKARIDAKFNSLVHLRHVSGLRAGHPNYRRYQHWGPYPQHTIWQASRFHNVIERVVVPLAREITDRHKKRLGLSKLYPWDSDAAKGEQATPKGLGTLKPFTSITELIEKTRDNLGELKPIFAHNIERMQKAEAFDLEARKGKGGFQGYCINREVSGIPFIGMNVGKSGTQTDVRIFAHENGHSMHSFANEHEPLIFLRDTWTDMTMAETASMTMELLTMDQSRKFYDSEEDFLRAKRIHLEELIRFLPWCAIVDKFQHWIYEHPEASPKERDTYFVHLMDRFYPDNISWDGLEKYRRNYWQMQIHITTAPFYYIDYGLAQLTAIQIYRHYLKNPKETIEQYYKGLKMGATKTRPRVWEVMTGEKYTPPGSPRFEPMVWDLTNFVMEQIDEIEKKIGDVSNKKGSH